MSVQMRDPILVTENRLWGWGGNGQGEIGDGTRILRVSPVQTIAGGTNWSVLPSNGYGTLGGIKTDGTLWLWGNNADGQIGDNTTIKKSSPVQTIAGGNNWRQLAVSNWAGAAIKTDDTLWTWGFNSYGQIGDNTTINKSSPVQTVAGGSNWSQVSLGRYNTAAIKTDGTLWVWGNNYRGAVGDNTVIQRNSPVQTVSGGSNWAQVSCGNNYTAAIKSDGTLWTWGSNLNGELGNNTSGSSTYKSSPVQTITGGSNWRQLSAQYTHMAAIKTDGTLWAWGDNYYGQMGNNVMLNKYSSPVQTIAGGSNWRQVSVSSSTTGAVKTDNTLWTWGYGDAGQMGNGSTSSVSSPVQTVAAGTNWSNVCVGTSVLGIRTSSYYA